MNYRILKSLVLLFLACNFYAQNFRMGYQLTYKEDSLSSKTTIKNMFLLVQGSKSQFLAEEQYKLDSLRSIGYKGFGVGDDSFVIINDEENISFKYYFFVKDTYEVKEWVELNWELHPETKKIGNYWCKKAILSYKGRTWEAWYTQELPIQCGPYIFRNLPGLIVDMRDSTGSYQFSLYSIKKASNLDIENKYKGAIRIQ